MKSAPFRAVASLCEKKLALPLHLPSIQRKLLVLGLQTVPCPFDLATSVSADPTAVNIHIDADIDIALDIDCDIGSRDRLPQSRSWRNG